MHFARDILGDNPNLLVRLLRQSRLPEIVVIDVAAGPVAHERHEGRLLFLSAEQLLHPLTEHAKVIRAQVARAHPTDVVQRIVREQREGPAVGVLHAQDEYFGIDRTGEVTVHRGLGRTPVHLHAVPGDAEQVGVGRIRFDGHAPAEDMLRHGAAAPGHARRSKLVHRQAHRVRETTRQPGAIGGVRFGQMNARHAARAVRVRGGHRNVIR